MSKKRNLNGIKSQFELRLHPIQEVSSMLLFLWLYDNNTAFLQQFHTTFFFLKKKIVLFFETFIILFQINLF